MKTVVVSQRVDFVKDRNEKRDSIDQNFSKFLFECDLLPMLMPNNLSVVSQYLKTFQVAGIILSGGNDLVKYGGNTPERDETEKLLINYAIQHNLPLLGICRGMQMIQDFFNVNLTETLGHVNIREKVLFDGKEIDVNSYHNLGTSGTNDELKVLAKSKDGVIKSVKHTKYRILGIMWHPERENPFGKFDIQLVKSLFE